MKAYSALRRLALRKYARAFWMTNNGASSTLSGRARRMHIHVVGAEREDADGPHSGNQFVPGQFSLNLHHHR
jgi:diadenosine tetraphosphate (Ap4A) HIT family hydrolase